MSFEAVLWATSDAPIADVNEFAVLVMLAEKADPDGCNTFPSRPTMASRTRVDSRTVLRCLQRLEERRLIAKGDQRAAAYIRADRRPVVYDLLIPYSWFPNIERINKERQERGRPPLTPADRPDIAPPPEKVRRNDLGKKRSSSRGVSKAPRKTGTQNGHGVSLSPPRGVSQSATGCLTDTRTSPLNPSDESLSPVVAKAEGARGRASTKEREKAATPENDTPPQTQDTHDDVRIAEAWIASRQAHGHGVPARARTRMINDAAKLLAEGEDPEHLVAAAADMGKQGNWFDLARHLEKFVPQPKVTVPGQRPALPDWCGVCNDGVEPAGPGQRLREENGRLIKCKACHPGATLKPNVNTSEGWLCARCERQQWGAPQTDGLCGPCRETARQEAMPPYCGNLYCDERDRLRDVEDANGFRVSVRCPDCHPAVVTAV